MHYQFWKHHDDDKYYWHGIQGSIVLSRGGPLSNPLDVMIEILDDPNYDVGASITYRDKPTN